MMAGLRPVGPASPPRDLTPTMRRQDHTILPYAATRLRQQASPGKAPFVSAPFDRSRILANPPRHHVSRLTLPRPPHPAPTFVTMANAPLAGQDAGNMRVIWGSGQEEFLI